MSDLLTSFANAICWLTVVVMLALLSVPTTIVFVTLKLAKKIKWKWGIVLIPFYVFVLTTGIITLFLVLLSETSM